MLKGKDSDFHISNWLRNRNILEFIKVWEEMCNPDFNYSEFAIIKTMRFAVYQFCSQLK